MKANMKRERKNGEKTDEAQSIENCKLERLKMTGGYGSASQAEAWAKGIQARQADIGCPVVQRPKRSGSRSRRPRLAMNRT